MANYVFLESSSTLSLFSLIFFPISWFLLACANENDPKLAYV